MASDKFFLFDTEPDAAFDDLTKLVCVSLDVPMALMSLVGEDRQFFKSAYGLPKPWDELKETPLSHSFCQHVVAMGKELAVEDAFLHPLVNRNLAIKDFGVMAYLGYPIHGPGEGGEDRVIGSICALDTKPRRWSARDYSTISVISQIVDRGILSAATLSAPNS